MGQQNTKGASISLDQLTNHYVVESTVPETNDKVLRDPATNQIFLMKELSLTNTEEFNKALEKLKRRKQLKHEHYFSLQEYYSKSESSFCSIFHKIAVVYQYSNHSLRNEVEARLHEEKTFDEKEVWSILCSCSLALSFLLKNGIEYSIISPEQIFLTQEGAIKMIDPELTSVQPEMPSRIHYFAPEQLSYNNNSKGFRNSQIFSLGMCILEILLLQPMSLCYDVEDFSFKLTEFEACLSKLMASDDYSDNLKKVLSKMLAINPNQRLGIETLERYLFEMVDGVVDVEQSDSKAKKYTDTDTVEQKIFTEPEIEKEVLSTALNACSEEPEELPCYNLWEFGVDAQNPDEAEGDNEGYHTQRSHQGILGTTNSNIQVGPKPYYEENTGHFKDSFKQKISQPEVSAVREQAMIAHFSSAMTFKQNNPPPLPQIPAPKLKSLPTFDNSGLFTDPKLLDMCRQDLAAINLKRSKVQQGECQTPSLGYSNPSFASFGNVAINSNTPAVKNVPIVFSQTLNNTGSEWQQPVSTELNAKSINPLNMSKAQKPEKDAHEDQFRQSSRHNNSSNLPQRNSLGFIVEDSNRHFQSQQYVESHFSSQFSSLADIARCSEPDRGCFEKKKTSVPPFANSNSASTKGPELKFVNEVFQKGRYEGQKLNGMRHGHGTFYYKQGGKYTGQWSQNKMDGKGVLYYYNQQVAYDGEWKDDKLSGRGVLYNEDPKPLTGTYDYTSWDEVDEYWIKYQGYFENDNKTGQGKLVLSNGEVFEGLFSEDEINGEGVFYALDGSVIHGLWENNKLVEEY